MAMGKLRFILGDMYRQASERYEAYRMAVRAVRAVSDRDAQAERRRIAKWQEDPMGLSEEARKARRDLAAWKAEHEANMTTDGRTPATEDETGRIVIMRNPGQVASLH
jgi:hypothetical protein